MKKIYTIGAAALALLAASCDDVDIPGAANEGLETVSNLAYSIDGRSLTLSWSLPAGNVSKVLIYRDDTQIAELEGAQTSYFIERAQTNQDNVYTVKVMMGDGLVSLGQSVAVRIDYSAPVIPDVSGGPLPAAFLLTASSIDEIADDDDKAAAQWFFDNYAAKGKGRFIKMNELDQISPSLISCLWVQCDLEDNTEIGWQNLPFGLADNATIEALKSFTQDGGNLLLTKHATQLVAAIGRTEYAPGIYGAGPGGEGGDYWMMQCNIGFQYDHRTHPIFAGMQAGDPNGYGFEGYYLEGPGWREDHNCMWDLNAYGFPGSPNVVVNFEDAASASVLATWGHVQDYCCAGIVEFNANAAFDGKVIAIGLSAYEFHQNTGNEFQQNIELLTANSINYLVDNGPQGEQSAKAGFLLTASADDDDVAAARWFAENYVMKGQGVMVTPEELASLDGSVVTRLWIQCDLEDGTEPGWQNLPFGLADEAFIAALKSYAEDGGNLLLTKHATQLVAAIGRTEYAPGIYGAGPGGEGSDYWMMQCNIGFQYDHRTHPIFAGMQAGDPNGYGFEGYYLEGPGWREDHNCMWDLNACGFPGTPNVVVNFEDAASASVLATWGHVQDYCCAGIIEFNANAAFDGKVIAIGLSAYEFHQNTGNEFQQNIEALTANSIEYLK